MPEPPENGSVITGAIENLVPDKSITIDGQTYLFAAATHVAAGVETGKPACVVVDQAGTVVAVYGEHGVEDLTTMAEEEKDLTSVDPTPDDGHEPPEPTTSVPPPVHTSDDTTTVTPEQDEIDHASEPARDHTVHVGIVEEIVAAQSITIDGQTFPLASAAHIEPEVTIGEQAWVIVDQAGLATSVTIEALDDLSPTSAPAQTKESISGVPEVEEQSTPVQPEPDGKPDIAVPSTDETDSDPVEQSILPPREEVSGPATSATAVATSEPKTEKPPTPPAPPAPPSRPPSRSASEPDPEDELQMTLLEHLEELRERLIKSVIALFVATIFSLIFAKQVLTAFQKLLPPDSQLQALKPTETYVVYFKVALLCGLAFAMPIIIYQFFAFIMPGLTRQERRWLYIVAPGAGILFVLGILFAYFVILPFGLPILQAFLSDIVTQEWRLEYYVSFVVRFLIITGLIFQTPLVIFFLSKLGIVSQERLARSRRYAVVIAAATAALLTPTTDPFTMLMVMGPMLILYEVGILLARFF